MKRRLELTDAYRNKMAADIKVNESNVQQYLLIHSEKIAQYIIDIGKLYRDYREKEKEYNEAYTEKWSYFRFRYEYSTNAADATQLTKGDKDITQLQYELHQIEIDLKELEGYLDALKNKYWTIKSYLDYRKFEAGV